MELFVAILMILAMIGVSNVVNHLLPFIPVPLIQIALGGALTFVFTDFQLHLEPELFFVLFIAPLLYNDGKHTPRSELWRLRAPIFLLAIGLVFATVLILGYIIHWMIPSIPLPVAFGLAAILSPTDPVAVSALAGRIHLPPRLMHLLEGEALMNDASGLVAFKFAIAAAVTGFFSLSQASVSFVVIFIGGLAVGALTALLITGLRSLLRRSGLDNETLHTLIHVLTPFVLFLTAEELGLSGILAAVAGGVVHAVERDHVRTIISRTNEMADHTWSILVFALNGLVFVLLGLQLPGAFRTVIESPAYNNVQVIGYAVAIYILLIALRFLWVYAYSRFYNKHRLGVSFEAMASLAGVRGAVTLAGAFTIPLAVRSGAPFPERNLVIFLAAAVILLSLLAASVLLPLLARQKETNQAAENAMKAYEGGLRMMRAAIRAVRQSATEHNEREAAAVIAEYNRLIRQSLHQEHGKLTEQEAALRIEALEIERGIAKQLLERGEIRDRHAEMFLEHLNEIELIVSGRRPAWFVVLKRLAKRTIRSMFAKRTGMADSDREAMRTIRLQTSGGVLEAFEEKSAAPNPSLAAEVLHHYRYIRNKMSAPYPFSKLNEQAKRDLQWIALQAEREEVQSLYVRNELTREAADELRRSTRRREAFILEQEMK
ncbi:Na+/H+ antiporter [Paenibacillus thermotolerans]|uniref:Na+/H+ antiporter n=1 Tax=Paenibacillus thermotolerans TaxID=3027807 RepID=UPI002368D4B4|nr:MULTISPECIES: Na+/H+ antiporter [unclassified Paenibacillus]